MASDRDPRQCGGTAAAAIVTAARGEPYYVSPWELWARVHAPEVIRPEPMDPWVFRLGHIAEPMLLADYERDTLQPHGLLLGRPLDLPAPAGYPWMTGHTDGVVLDADGRIVGIPDAKTTATPWHWWATGPDGARVEVVPPGYEVQMRWYLALARLAGHPAAFADLVVLDLLSRRVFTRQVLHDEAEWQAIAAIVVPWWERRMLGGEPPPDDGSEVNLRWRLYQERPRKSSRLATPEEARLVADWRSYRAAEKAAKAAGNAAEAAILASLDTERLTLGDEKSAPYVQVQRASGKGRALRAYRFPEPGDGPTHEEE